MSGHSKWATIKHAKGAADAKRGQLFTKFIKEISIAARMGGGDPNSNPRLRTAILKARASNMPKDNIERAIKKGTGELGGAVFEEKIYEGYAAGGVAVLVEVLTDNNNRAAANVRNIFGKTGGNLGATGSVSYMFNRKGVIEYDAEAVSEDELMEAGLEAGAEDIANEDGVITVTTDPNDFDTVLEALQTKGYESVSAGISMVPDTYIKVDAETARKVDKLINRLEEDDDVQNVYSNVEYPDDYSGEE
ncbi:MAG: YebC/PmpR family DNA-binding transcriptional regulator [Bacteroides sp.]|nr:YebC/PmpR family DNA-binding transcriptional regulator [Prevotella sp.]MCM1407844.1 YebC/PmpR family DNA-binding transcriptional regulator [Treponema brennaborense]MCM1469586.1 YebC/PmpR family DNA-binding transcriptional regulator [Bacteroides sp.]